MYRAGSICINKEVITEVSRKAVSKGIYKELKSKLITTPTQSCDQLLRFNGIFEEAQLEWKEIYSLPFKVAFDTKSREFQCKIINSGYLGTNVHLKRIGKLNSSACSFRE